MLLSSRTRGACLWPKAEILQESVRLPAEVSRKLIGKPAKWVLALGVRLLLIAAEDAREALDDVAHLIPALWPRRDRSSDAPSWDASVPSLTSRQCKHRQGHRTHGRRSERARILFRAIAHRRRARQS